MYFCNDVDLMAWEPGIFLEASFAHQAIVKEAAGTLTGTALAMSAATLGDVASGMVASVETADGTLTQLLEVVNVADASHATVSALRGRGSEAALAPLTGGSVKVTVVSFRPQIAAVGDGLLALMGIESGRDSADPSLCDTSGFGHATVFGVLAAVFRTLATASTATNLTYSKLGFYEGLYRGARRAIAATVDRDGDGVPETRRRTDVGKLVRG
jgi:hypothetical protein